MTTENDPFTTYLDVDKACNETTDLYIKFSNGWIRFFGDSLMTILESLAKEAKTKKEKDEQIENAKKTFLDTLDRAKKIKDDGMEDFADLVSNTMREAYVIGFIEGCRKAEHEVFTNMKSLVDDGVLPDDENRLSFTLVELEKASKELFAKHMQGKSLTVMMPDNFNGQKPKNSV